MMYKILPYFGMLFVSFIHVSEQVPSSSKGASFEFIRKENWKHPKAPSTARITKHMYLRDNLNISCETNKPDAVVKLQHRPTRQWQSALTNSDGRIEQNGQVFILRNMKVGDGGDYKCVAERNGTSIEYSMGQLIVSPIIRDLLPSIYPRHPPTLETYEKYTVRCETKGYAGWPKLTWYRKQRDGIKTKVQSVDTKENSRGNTFYIAKLKFENFTSVDVGVYICERRVETTIRSKNISMQHQPDVAPAIKITPFKTRPKENSLLILRCEVTGSPRPQRRWKRNGREHICMDLYKACELKIETVKYPKHNGTFTCTAKNFVGDVNKSVAVEVLVPPILKKSYGDSVRARSNEDVELFCDVARSNPPPTVTWYQQECHSKATCNVNDVSSWKQIDTQIPKNTTRTMSSYIITPKVDVDYLYRCVATNPSDKDSNTFKLFRSPHNVNQFAIIPEVDVLTSNEKDKFSIQCKTDTNIYNQVTLKKIGFNISYTEDMVENTKVLKYTVDAADLSHAGTYKCEANSLRGGPRSKSIQVIVKQLLPPSIHNFADTTILQRPHHHYEINCNASGNPSPTVLWKFNDAPLPKTKIIDSIRKCNDTKPGIYHIAGTTNKLVVCVVDFDKYQGKYECNATNELSSRIATMNLTIEAKPEIIKWEETKQVILSDQIDLICNSKANPIAVVSWYRIHGLNDLVLLESAKERSRMILTVEQGHDRYMCQAENIHGNVRKEMTFTIVEGSRKASEQNNNIIVIGIVTIVIVIISVLLLMYWYKRRLQKRYAKYLEPDPLFQIDPDRSLFEQSNDLPYDAAWEFPRDRLVFIKTLGSGAFGEVWLAEASGIHAFKPRDTSTEAASRRKSLRKTKRYHSISIKYRKQEDRGKIVLEKTLVAVKKLKRNATDDEYKDLASELKIIIHLGEHKNIVNLLGSCTTGGADLYVILECCPHGDLLKFLKAKREIFQPEWYKNDTSMENELTYIDLLMIALQVSKGMDFLQSRKCVHRDLAARNVLIGDDYVIKISDFGMARDIAMAEVYRKETSGLLPLKWMAPEAIFDRTYTSMSDVWSFGILLWEVFTLGAIPYPSIPIEDLGSFIADGRRMDCPTYCPKEIYGIMLDCWVQSPYGRPIFGQLTERIGNCLKQNVHNDTDYPDEIDSPEENYLNPVDLEEHPDGVDDQTENNISSEELPLLVQSKEKTHSDSISDGENASSPTLLPRSPLYPIRYTNPTGGNYQNITDTEGETNDNIYDPVQFLQRSPASPTPSPASPTVRCENSDTAEHYVNTTDNNSRSNNNGRNNPSKSPVSPMFQTNGYKNPKSPTDYVNTDTQG